MSPTKTRNISEARLKAKLAELPTLPAIVARLASLERTSEGYFEEVLGLLESDPPFAARTLRLANSAAMSPTGEIRSLREALSRVGTDRVRDLVLSSVVTQVFVPTTEAQRALWVHSVQTATAARQLAGLPGKAQMDGDQAFLGGLLHDIGRFLMFRDDPEEPDRIEEFQWNTPEELIAAERELCGYDHADLGWRACRAWRLPESVGTIVRHHHAVGVGGTHPEVASEHPEVGLVALADALSVRLMKDPSFLQLSRERKLDRLDAICARHLHTGFTSEQLVEIEPKIRAESKAAALALGLETP